MEIIIPDISYDNEKIEEESLLNEIKEDLKSFSNDFEIKETDIGRGADLPVILGIIAITMTLPGFIDSSINLVNKFQNLYENLRNKYGEGLRICEQCACLLATKYIYKIEKNAKIIENIYSHIISVDPPFRSKDRLNHLDERPEGFYIQIYKVNEDIFYMFNIKSNGKFELKYKFVLPEWYNF